MILLVVLLLVGCASKPTAQYYHDWRKGEHWCDVTYANGHTDRRSWRQGEVCDE